MKRFSILYLLVFMASTKGLSQVSPVVLSDIALFATYHEQNSDFIVYELSSIVTVSDIQNVSNWNISIKSPEGIVILEKRLDLLSDLNGYKVRSDGGVYVLNPLEIILQDLYYFSREVEHGRYDILIEVIDKGGLASNTISQQFIIEDYN